MAFDELIDRLRNNARRSVSVDPLVVHGVAANQNLARGVHHEPVHKPIVRDPGLKDNTIAMPALVVCQRRFAPPPRFRAVLVGQRVANESDNLSRAVHDEGVVPEFGLAFKRLHPKSEGLTRKSWMVHHQPHSYSDRHIEVDRDKQLQASFGRVALPLLRRRTLWLRAVRRQLQIAPAIAPIPYR